MQVISTVNELVRISAARRGEGKQIALVPTMGTLHEGHLSLIRRAREENDIVFVSIFVNPVQFNNLEDLRKYPRTLDADVELIENLADYVFAPTQEEVFPEPPTEEYHFGSVEEVMEGAARPGHFNGVGIIVGRLLRWVNPHKAYFGEKDYQQIAVIRELVRQCNFATEIVSCPIVREPSGLARSSRNRLLTQHQLEISANIHRILEESKKQPDVPQIKNFVEQEISKIDEFKLDYFEISNDATLQSVQSLSDADGVMGFITVYVGDVRLIDNIRYK